MSRSLLLACLLVGCGRIDFDARGSDAPSSDATGDAALDGPTLAPIHHYRFDGDLRDELGGPDLTTLVAGSFTPSGYEFPVNGGLVLSTPGVSNVYTIDMTLALDEVTSWRKLLDVDGGQLDRGFYCFEGALQDVIVPLGNVVPDFVTSTAVFEPLLRVRVTLTRDASDHVVGYIDKAPIGGARSASEAVPPSPPGRFEYDDAGGSTRILSELRLFVDDMATSGGEASAGSVRELAIWDVALTEVQVGALQKPH